MKKLVILGFISFLTGATAVAQTSNPESQLRDEMSIQMIPTEIDMAVDQKDWERARSYFTDTIYVDFSSLTGIEPATIPADDLIAGWASNLGPQKQSYHQRGLGRIDLAGDTATTYSHGYAWNRLEGNGDPLWEVWGNYTYELERTPQGWKVTAMSFEMTHERGNVWVRDTPSPTN